MTTTKTQTATPKPQNEAEWIAYAQEKAKLDEVVYPTVTDVSKPPIAVGIPSQIEYQADIPDSPLDHPIIFGEPYVAIGADLVEIGGVQVRKVATWLSNRCNVYMREEFFK